jgi:[acyl-carrier-protein] S-malonyltransferase
VREAFLFPGQGSEAPQMGGNSLRRPGPVRRLLDRASAALGIDLADIIARGELLLTKPEVGQPALVAVSLGLALELDASGIHPSATAGHSVGEGAAFCIAGCFQPEEAIDCVIERARLMAAAARQRPGGMAALRVTTDEELQAALALGAKVGHVELAAHNSPQEWVLTGDRPALSLVASRFPTVPLPVAGPWHSHAMAEVASTWRQTLRTLTWSRPRLLLVANAAGRAVAEDDDLIELLVGQLTRPVQWAETMRTLAAEVTRWHVFGEGRVLRGLCRTNLGERAEVYLHNGWREGETARPSARADTSP